MVKNTPCLEDLAKEVGDSFYLLDTEIFKSNFQQLLSAFQAAYDNTRIAYSYKTNYVPPLCSLVDDLGGAAEVVSDMELQLALNLGVLPENIFYNGPFKQLEHSVKLLAAGGVVNIDSLDELERLARHADLKGAGVQGKVGIRCSFETHDGRPSRFGIDTSSPDFATALDVIDANPDLTLVGLHCHFAPRTLECWSRTTSGMLAVIERFFKSRFAELEFVSLGGGLNGPMTEQLKEQFNHNIPSFADYANVSAAAFAEYVNAQPSKHKPQLIIEPGTALCADAMDYVCRVVSIKRNRGIDIISLDGSRYNISPNSSGFNPTIVHVPKSSQVDKRAVKNAYLCGYTCIESDVLATGFTGEAGVGDFFVFKEVGSYSVVMKPPFIRPNVAIVKLMADGKRWSVTKRAETFEDVFATYI